MATFKQLDIFGETKEKRIYFRDSLGQFASREVSEVDKLYRENNRLKLEVEKWRRKAEVLAKYKIEIDRYNHFTHLKTTNYDTNQKASGACNPAKD